MIEERRTGKLSWRKEGWGWDLEEEVVGVSPSGITMTTSRHTLWWIWRFMPFWPCPYEVIHTGVGDLKTVKRFLSLEKAKAFAEVMHRLGVRPC